MYSHMTIFVGVAILWFMTFVAYSNIYPTNSPIDNPMLNMESLTTDTSQVEIVASNSYTNVHQETGSAQNVYPWLQSNALLVEPHRLTTLRLKTDTTFEYIASKANSYNWTISSLDENGGWVFYSGFQVEHTFTTLTTYVIQACAVGGNNLHMDPSVRCTRAKAICRYVRRELRALSPEDRDLFLDAMRTLMDVPTGEGMAQFGSSYRDWYHFVLLHHTWSSPQTGDQMHDGVGFLTQHAALSSAFEVALQAVAPSVSLPWWDLTLDWARVVVEFNGTFDGRFWSSELWRPDFFGHPDNHTRTVTEGRFAYIAAASPTGSRDTVNAYGYIRAPWNYNRSPWMTRGAELNGLSVFYNCAFSSDAKCSVGPWPSCQSHLDAVTSSDYESLTSFAWFANYDPHAHVHVVLGGGWGLNLTNLVGKLGSGDREALQAKVWGLRNVWRTQHKYAPIDAPIVTFPTYCSVDTPEYMCHASCDLEVLRSNVSRLDKAWWAVNDWMETYGTYNAATKLETIKTLCDAPFQMGEQSESASPLDPTFWPIHPTIERLWQWRKLLGGFTDEEWTQSSGACVMGGRCTGHQPEDLTLAPLTRQVDGDFETLPITNADYLTLMDPSSSSASFVYSDFSNQHCSDLGFTFPSIVESMI